MYLRQGKLLLAVQAVKKAQQVAGEADPSVHSMVARLADAVVAAAPSPAAEAEAGNGAAVMPAVVLEVAQEETAALLGSSDVSAAAAAAHQQQWAAQHAGNGLRHAAAAAEVMAPDARGAAVQRLLAAGPAGGSHADCVAVHDLLASKLQMADAAATWRQQCSATFRWSPVLGGADCVSVPAPWEEDAAKKAAAAAEWKEGAEVNGIADKAAKLAL